ncbi:MAG: hypothetical protein K2Y31_04905 [Burkholderiales bacterium]|jgi:hypothetical protein|nr:hypothetical protein [Burkholderiales bacterium]
MSVPWLSERYMLLISGKLRAGLSRAEAADALQRLLAVDAAQAAHWLQGGWQLLRIGLDAGEAKRLAGLLSKAGMETRQRRMTDAEKAHAMGYRESAADLRAFEDDQETLSAAHPELVPALEAMSMPAHPEENQPASGKLPCPCCGWPALTQRGAGEECVACGWRDYRGQSEYQPDKVVPGRNFGLNLSEARKEYEAYGSINPAHYTPNAVPLRTRFFNILLALFFVAYSGYCLWIGQMYFPFINKYAPGQSMAITFQGAETWVMAAALLSSVLFCVLSVVDHYDKRRNERSYQLGVQISMVLFGLFMMIAMIMYTFRVEGLGTALWMVFGTLVILGALAVRFSRGRIEY